MPTPTTYTLDLAMVRYLWKTVATKSDQIDERNNENGRVSERTQRNAKATLDDWQSGNTLDDDTVTASDGGDFQSWSNGRLISGNVYARYHAVPKRRWLHVVFRCSSTSHLPVLRYIGGASTIRERIGDRCGDGNW